MSARRFESGKLTRVRRRSDGGSSTPEIVVILPVLMLLVAFGVQFALWALASQAVSDAAARGDAALRATDGAASTARAAVQTELNSLASGLVLRPIVSVSVLPDGGASLSVSGFVPSLIPDVRLGVSATSAGPEQRFRATG